MKLYRVGILLALAACDPLATHDPALRLETLETRIAAGQDVNVRFTSLSDEMMHYNECYAVLERWAQRRWDGVGPASGDVPCRDIRRALAPGASGTVAFPIPFGLFPGTYRYRFTAFYDGNDELLPLADRVTNRFSVVAAGVY